MSCRWICAACFAKASCHKYSTYSASWLQDAAGCYQLLEHAEYGQMSLALEPVAYLDLQQELDHKLQGPKWSRQSLLYFHGRAWPFAARRSDADRTDARKIARCNSSACHPEHSYWGAHCWMYWCPCMFHYIHDASPCHILDPDSFCKTWVPLQTDQSCRPQGWILCRCLAAT